MIHETGIQAIQFQSPQTIPPDVHFMDYCTAKLLKQAIYSWNNRTLSGLRKNVIEKSNKINPNILRNLYYLEIKMRCDSSEKRL